MWSQLINIVLLSISIVLTVYNVNISKVQKTPVQQNWLSIGLAIQTLLPIVYYLGLRPNNVLSSYIVYAVIIYCLLYNTKFCISCKKSLIKKFILMLSMYIPIIYFLLSIELFKCIEPLVDVGYLTTLFLIKNPLILLITTLLIIANTFICFLDRKNVNSDIIILRVFLNIGLLFTGTTILLSNYNLLIVSKIILIIIDILLVKIIWVNKGRFHKND